MGKEQTEPVHVDETKKPLYVLDQGLPMPLYPTEINGVVVYTPTAEKTRELKERYASMFPSAEPKSTRSHKWLSSITRWLNIK